MIKLFRSTSKLLYLPRFLFFVKYVTGTKQPYFKHAACSGVGSSFFFVVLRLTHANAVGWQNTTIVQQAGTDVAISPPALPRPSLPPPSWPVPPRAGKLGVIASEEEDHPVLVEEAFNSKFVAVFDPLDGSSNIDAAISTGTIFGIFEETEVRFVFPRGPQSPGVFFLFSFFIPGADW